MAGCITWCTGADSDIVQLVEVKCPFTKRSQTIISACDDKKFCLELSNGVPKLKRQHPYFYQCQGIMAIITEIDKLDFVVYYGNNNWYR